MFTLFFHLVPRVYLLYYIFRYCLHSTCVYTLSCAVLLADYTRDNNMSNLFPKMNSYLVNAYYIRHIPPTYTHYCGHIEIMMRRIHSHHNNNMINYVFIVTTRIKSHIVNNIYYYHYTLQNIIHIMADVTVDKSFA